LIPSVNPVSTALNFDVVIVNLSCLRIQIWHLNPFLDFEPEEKAAIRYAFPADVNDCFCGSSKFFDNDLKFRRIVICPFD
jgi:hypothetical protein